MSVEPDGPGRIRTAAVISHVGFEDLGLLAPLLARRGVAVRHIDAPRADLASLDPANPDLLVVLGGPIGAYETGPYPFLVRETAIIEARLAADRPTLGVCLGAQLMAKAMGARVYPSGVKEIGWSPLNLSAAGRRSCLAPAGAPGLSVLHWHGDTFDLPDGAVHLASSAACDNQAFGWGVNGLGLQFHLETDAAALESWFVGHAVELAAAGLSVEALRADSARLAPACNAAGRAVLAAWLDGLSSGEGRGGPAAP